MFDQIKQYLIEVAVKKYVPMAVMAALAALGAYLAAHAGILEQYGVTYHTWPFAWPAGQEPTGPCLLLELDTLGAKVIILITAGIAVLLRLLEHHAMAKPKDTPPPKGEI